MVANTGTNIYPTVQSPLDEDEPKFVITDLSGFEGMSQPFSFELTLTSLDDEIVFEDLIAQSVTVSIPLAADNTRYFNGIIADLSQSWSSGSGSEGDYRTEYRATLVPKLWLLSRVQNSRVYQGMTVPDIVADVLGRNDVTSHRFDLRSGDYAERDFCVQYRETDLAFISRLLEEEGVYYYFEQAEDDHTLVMADGSVAHVDVAPDGNIESLELRRELRSARFALRDFDFSEPNMDLSAGIDSGASPASGEVYDYPGGERDRDGGAVKIARAKLERYNRIRLEEEEAKVVQLNGAGDRRTFSPGLLFDFVQARGRQDMADKSFLLLQVSHSMTQAGGGMDYQNSFTCLDSEIPYRPPRSTPRPRVEGPQTAIVVGPSGEERAHTDEHGRCKVKFHWDRDAAGDDTSSCWIRISQPWAGNGWGSVHLPHVGHEVIVEFLEGNPDRPIITGRVYHGVNTPPQGLPDNKHKSIHRDHYGNEIILDATPGDEHIRIYSPHHESMLQLGKSFKHWSDSDQEEVAWGNKLGVLMGNNVSFTGGSKNIGTVGISHTAAIGGALDLFVGYKMAAQLGPAYSWRLGRNIDNAKGSKVSSSNANNIMTAAETLNLIGGVTDSGTMSAIGMKAKSFQASVGPNKNPSTKGKVAKFAPVGVGIGAAVASITAIAGAVAVHLGTHEDRPSAEDANVSYTQSTLIVQAAIEAAMVIVIAILASVSKETVATKTHTDDGGDEPNGLLWMDTKGQVGLRGTKHVQLRIPKTMPKGKSESGHAIVSLEKLNKIKIFTKDDATDQTHIDMALDKLTVQSGGPAKVEAKAGDLTLKASGKVVVDAGGPFEANKALTVLP